MTAVARLLVTRRFAPLLVAVSLLSAGLVPGHEGKSAAAVEGEQAAVRSEVRLRKLHLVRPDLIPYPIAYEVCC